MSFTVNRNNELTSFLPELKKLYKTGKNTEAIYNAIEDLLLIKIPEVERLKKIELEYNAIIEALTQKMNLENQLKLAI